MASAAEQLASNLNFSTFAKAEDLKKRLWFTLAALLVYRLGTHIPLPGLNPEAYAAAFQGQAGGNIVGIGLRVVHAFRFHKNLMAFPVREAGDFVFNGWAVTRPGSRYGSAVHGRSRKGLVDDFVGARCGPGLVAQFLW